MKGGTKGSMSRCRIPIMTSQLIYRRIKLYKGIRKSLTRNFQSFSSNLHQLNGDPSFGCCVEQSCNQHMLDLTCEKTILFHTVGSRKRPWLRFKVGFCMACQSGQYSSSNAVVDNLLAFIIISLEILIFARRYSIFARDYLIFAREYFLFAKKY